MNRAALRPLGVSAATSRPTLSSTHNSLWKRPSPTRTLAGSRGSLRTTRSKYTATGRPFLSTFCANAGDVRTAYPRVSKVFDDPQQGLASIEALYLAKRLLGDDDASLLDGYHWREEFLRQFDADTA